MGRKSSIEALPPDILAELEAMLLKPRLTQREITSRINKMIDAHNINQTQDAISSDAWIDDVDWSSRQLAEDVPPVSKSAVGRYAQTFKDLTAEIAETDRVSALMLKELGISNQSNVAQATAETLRVMLLHFLPMLKSAMNAEDLSLKELKDVTAMLKDLSAGHERLENSASINERRRREIEREAMEKARAEAAVAAEGAARTAGLSSDTVDQIRREILGIAA